MTSLPLILCLGVVALGALSLIKVSATQSGRKRRLLQGCALGIMGLALVVSWYSIGYQAGKDRALRDNRADASAEAMSS